MAFLADYGYVGMFAAAFLAATVLPLSSEIVLGILLLNGLPPVLLVTVATLGNVLGAVANYGLGYGGTMVFQRRLAKTSEKEINASLARFEKYGSLSLLLAWAPVIGDPLTVAAGVLRVNMTLFLLLVTAGKLGRYVIIAYWIL